MFGFSATLAAPDEARNAILRMQLYVGGASTSWIGYRENWVRDLCEPGTTCTCDGGKVWVDRQTAASAAYSGACAEEKWHTAENVAVSGVIEVDAASTGINVINSGAVTYTASNFLLWARRLTER